MKKIIPNESDKIRGKDKMNGDDTPKKKKEGYKEIMLSCKGEKK